MPFVGEKTLKIVNLHNSGMPIIDIAKSLNITPSSVEKRLRTYRKFSAGGHAHTIKPQYTWETSQIKEGFDKFVAKNGRLPTADEIDKEDYLPSTRQIQRRYGGLEKLREQLGYSDLHFGRGVHRSRIQKDSRQRGNNAEQELYIWLVEKFGEPFVHSEKEYGDVRNRADFLVYAEGLTLGIDVFATNTLQTLRKNVDIKARKYVRFPGHLPLLFIAWGEEFAQSDVNRVCATHLKSLPNLRVMSAKAALKKLENLTALVTPQGFKPMIRTTKTNKS